MRTITEGRRKAIKFSALAAGSMLLPFSALEGRDAKKKKYSIGACDWSLEKRNDVAALQVASELGLDGVQISLGNVENNMHLRQKSVQRAYKQAVKKYGVKIGGIAIGELNSVPYATDPRTDDWVSDSIDVAAEMGVKVILIAFFGKGDINDSQDKRNRVIDKFLKVASKAESAGVVLGIESWMNAEKHLEIIKAVDSPNLKVYYDVANSHKMGYDIYQEIKMLGKEMICEFHMKENGFKLGEGSVDFIRVAKLLEEINYEGWMQIEGARPEGSMLIPTYRDNLKFLRSHFS